MARMHRGVVIGIGAIAAFGVGVAGVAYGAGRMFGFFGGDEVAPVVAAAPLKVEYGDEPRTQPEEKPTPAPAQRASASERISRASTGTAKTQTKKAPPSLTDKFLARVNSGEMLTFGEQIENREGGFSDGACSTSRPYRVRAMVADNATTDQPGLAIGMVTENIQGEESDGTPCVAVPAGAVVGFMVAQAGEYATNRVPVTVEAIWMGGGEKIEVGQPAKWIDGVPGVVGKANHHVWSKTLAMIGAVAFRGFDNVTSFGQFSSGDATDPIEDAIAAKFNRPSEISFTRGVAAEFDLMPVSTQGY